MRGCAGSSNSRRAIASLVVGALLGGVAVASDRRERLELLGREDARVAAVFLRLARAATPYCRRKGPQMGMVLHHLAQYAPSARADAAALFGLDDRVAVLAVVPGGPAAAAGLAPGDAVASVNGVALPAGAPGNGQRGDAVREAEDRIDHALEAGAVTLGVIRAGGARNVHLVAEQACAAHVQLLPSNRFEARANERMISISTAAVELAAIDDELAFLLAHELGHVARDGDRDEYEADRLGARIVAGAGFDPRAAPAILVRMARARGQGMRLDLNHPSLNGRLSALHALVDALGTSAPPPG